MSVRVRAGPTPLLWTAVRKMHLKSGSRQRPETATLEKPLILDPKLLRKVDMTRLTRDRLLTIENLISTPKKTKQSPKKMDKTKKSEESGWEDEESSAVEDFKPRKSSRIINTTFRVRSHVRKGLREVFAAPAQLQVPPTKEVPKIKSPKLKENQANRHKNVEEVVGTLILNDNQVPSPCRSCGRSERPERLHAHPTVPHNKRSKLKDDQENAIVAPQKNTVTKPVAMKFRSGKTRTKHALERTTVEDKPVEKDDKKTSPLIRRETFKIDRATKNALSVDKKTTPSPSPTRKTSLPLNPPAKKQAPPRPPEKTPPLVVPTSNPVVHSASPRRPKTITCYLCQKQFGTASYSLHEPHCLQRWQRENPGQTPPREGFDQGPGPPAEPRRPSVAPQPQPESAWDHAWQSAQAKMVPCDGCAKTFLPHRLEAHHRVCQAHQAAQGHQGYQGPRRQPQPQPSAIPVPVPALAVTAPPSDALVAQSDEYDSELEPPSYHCHICGRVFDKEAVASHERLCLRRWQLEHSRDSASASSSPPSSACSTPRRRRPVLCYLCGRQFGSASIAIHEPQCLRRWHQENDRLPEAKRRAQPPRPDTVFDPVSGEVDFRATEEAQWKCHLVQLVPCGRCGRTFNPDRVAVHERCCKGPAPAK